MKKPKIVDQVTTKEACAGVSEWLKIGNRVLRGKDRAGLSCGYDRWSFFMEQGERATWGIVGI